MKKNILAIGLLLLGFFARAQNGLENIIVEKYYVSNAADAAGSTGVLPVGSVTYRLFADLLPGYNFQALYGVSGHTLLVQTSTAFFNNEDYGGTVPTISTTNIRKNSALLDSYFSVGGSATGRVGVLKTEDTDGSPGNAQSILQNNDASAGAPINIGATTSLSAQDGMIPGSPVSVTYVGINNTGNGDLGVLDGTSQVGGLFSTSNGSVAALGGATGPTATNRVFIGQFTTNGIFHFELNAQIGTPGGGTQSFVAASPVGSEISIPSLTGTFGAPNTLPTVSITSPANGSSFVTGTVVAISANASDVGGTITSVEFFVDGVSLSTDNTSPYSANYTSTAGSHTLTARATDNDGGQTTSAAVTINVANNPLPTVSITSPSNGAMFIAGSAVAITANASDDGSVASVEFFVDGVSLSVDNSSPYTASYTGVLGPHTLTARATDNLGAQTTSAAVTINVVSTILPYRIISTAATCVSNLFCLPVAAINAVNNVIGYDVVMNYDKTRVLPTGNVTVSSSLINPYYVNAGINVDTAAGSINISLYLNASAPPNTKFSGTGNVFCVEFTKTGNFTSVDTATFTIPFLQESYFTGVSSQFVEPGKYSTYQDSSFKSSLKFWLDNSPIRYDALNPSQYLITNIYGNNAGCSSLSAAVVNPDLSGSFDYNVLNGPALTIKRDILGTTNVQPVINGFDAFLTQKVLINDPGFVPSVYQMICMDVNMDGVVSAGDLSQINQRAVMLIPEFKQAWNYSAGGVSNGQLSKDWLFIDATTVSTNPAYRISTTFPLNDGIGYSKARVPVIPFCLAVPVSNIGSCPVIGVESYKGILVGDINGNFATVGSGGLFRQRAGSVVFDLSKAVTEGGYIDIPVSISSIDPVNALDFSMNLNGGNLTFISVTDHTNYLRTLTNENPSDNILRFTSSSLQQYETGKTLVSVRFALQAGQINERDLNSLTVYLNGEEAGVEVRTTEKAAAVNAASVDFYPNPASGTIHVTVMENATLELLNMEGSQVLIRSEIKAGQMQEINIQGIADGIYILKAFNNNFMSMKKVVIAK